VDTVFTSLNSSRSWRFIPNRRLPSGTSVYR